MVKKPVLIIVPSIILEEKGKKLIQIDDKICYLLTRIQVYG
jgi:hypothetical protein